MSPFHITEKHLDYIVDHFRQWAVRVHNSDIPKLTGKFNVSQALPLSFREGHFALPRLYNFGGSIENQYELRTRHKNTEKLGQYTRPTEPIAHRIYQHVIKVPVKDLDRQVFLRCNYSINPGLQQPEDKFCRRSTHPTWFQPVWISYYPSVGDARVREKNWFQMPDSHILARLSEHPFNSIENRRLPNTIRTQNAQAVAKGIAMPNEQLTRDECYKTSKRSNWRLHKCADS
ncbi:hypothetical protein GCM10008942_06760 [Rhizomicrobium electricum]|uniref:Uncharacterized protein n=1 Tax=Rhizomicrobium electricum TaxID=480070 RepID=A0ABN1E7X2_9PROT